MFFWNFLVELSTIIYNTNYNTNNQIDNFRHDFSNVGITGENFLKQGSPFTPLNKKKVFVSLHLQLIFSSE